VAAGLLTQGACGPVESPCGAVGRLRAGQPPAEARPCSLRGPPAGEACPCQWWSRPRRGRSRRGRQARPHHPARGSTAGQTISPLPHCNATPRCPRPARIRRVALLEAAVAWCEACRRRAGRSPGTRAPGGPLGAITGATRKRCARQRIGGWGLAWICRSQQRFGRSSSCRSAPAAAGPGWRRRPWRIGLPRCAPPGPIAVANCLSDASSACCCGQHIARAKRSRSASPCDAPPSPSSRGDCRGSMLCNRHLLGALACRTVRRQRRIGQLLWGRGC